MMAVIFEFEVLPGQDQEYFALAQEMRESVEKIDGFISVERFQSLSDAGKYVSLSLWRDAEAVRTWREQLDHRQVQAKGKSSIFKKFRLLVADIDREIIFDDGARSERVIRKANTG